MPGSQTTRGQTGARFSEPVGVAFRFSNSVGTRCLGWGGQAHAGWATGWAARVCLLIGNLSSGAERLFLADIRRWPLSRRVRGYRKLLLVLHRSL